VLGENSWRLLSPVEFVGWCGQQEEGLRLPEDDTMLGPLVAGILADRTGSYVPGFSVLAACAAAGSVAFLLARRPATPQALQRRAGEVISQEPG